MKLSNNKYDTLKWIALVAFPALTALWLTLGQVWGIHYTTEIGTTLAALDTFLGALLGISGKSYTPDTDGTLHVAENGDAYATFNKTPQELAGSTATLEVKSV